MPRKKAAFRALRKSTKRYHRNRIIQKKLKDLRKQTAAAIASKNMEQAMTLYTSFQKLVDKASKANGFMNKNTAARYKSKLHKAIQKARRA